MKLSIGGFVHHGMIGLLILINTVYVKYMISILSVYESRFIHGRIVIDYYQNARGVILFIVSCVLLLNLLIGILNKRVQVSKDRYAGLMLLFMSIIALSFLLSPFKDTADEGFYETFEGVSVLLSYCILAISMSMMPLSNKIIRYYIVVFSVSVGIVVIASVLQYFGQDPLRWDIVRNYAATAFLSSDPPENGYGLSAHGFFSNPNYLSSFFSMFVPFLYTIFIILRRKSRVIIVGLLIMITHFSVFASGCASALMIVIIGMIGTKKLIDVHLTGMKRILWHSTLFVPLFYFAISNKGLGFGKEAVVAMIAYVILNYLFKALTIYNVSMRNVTVVCLTLTAISIIGFSQLPSKLHLEGLTSIYNENGNIQLTTDGTKYEIYANDDMLMIRNINSATSLILLSPNDSSRHLLSQKLWVEKDSIEDKYYYKLMPYEVRFEVDRNRLYYLNAGFKRDQISQPLFYGPDGYGSIGNGRLYLWQHTLPVIFKHPVLGTGPDTYGLVFPQNDILSKIKYTSNPYSLATKAHSTYLNYAVNLGVSGAFAYIGIQFLVVLGLLKFIKLQKKTTFAKAMLGSLVLYGIVSVVNDSRIFLAIYHWTLTGMAISLIRFGYEEYSDNIPLISTGVLGRE